MPHEPHTPRLTASEPPPCPNPLVVSAITAAAAVARAELAAIQRARVTASLTHGIRHDAAGHKHGRGLNRP